MIVLAILRPNLRSFSGIENFFFCFFFFSGLRLRSLPSWWSQYKSRRWKSGHLADFSGGWVWRRFYSSRKHDSRKVNKNYTLYCTRVGKLIVKIIYIRRRRIAPSNFTQLSQVHRRIRDSGLPAWSSRTLHPATRDVRIRRYKGALRFSLWKSRDSC